MNWNPNLYEDKHSFVWHYGAEILDILSPQPDERILDLGCGTGQLTQQIASSGAQVIGIDSSPDMIEQASRNYPHLKFLVADGSNFSFDIPFDAVFSNAALHWIKNAQGVINCVKKALKPGGRFVAEFGGKGNIEAILTATETVLSNNGYAIPPDLNPWYYPSSEEYTQLLQEGGFEVIEALWFERPTPLEAGPEGMKNWLEMFANRWLNLIPEAQKPAMITEIEALLKSKLYQNNTWIADYKRLRVVAQKVEL